MLKINNNFDSAHCILISINMYIYQYSMLTQLCISDCLDRSQLNRAVKGLS